MKKNLFILILIMVIAIVGVACSKKEEGAKTTKNSSDSLVVAITEEPASGFDPAFDWPLAGDPIFQSKLFKFDTNTKVINDLATNYTVNKDASEYVVTMRDDVVSSDGVALTAKDVVFSYETIAKTNTRIDLSTLENVTAVDDHTIKFKLKSPNSTFIRILAKVPIIPEHAYTEDYAQNPIGSGPYQLVQWDKGQQMIIEANPNYYGEEPKTKRITFLFLDNDATFAAVQRGEVDIARVSINLGVKDVEGYTKKNLKTVDSLSMLLPSVKKGEVEKDGVPLGNDVTADIAIRKAINYAIDRQEMVDTILNGFGSPAYSLFEYTDWYNEETAFKDGDIKKANEILEEGGWKDSDGDGIKEKGDLKAEFTLYATPSDQTSSPRQAICLYLQQKLKEVGIKLNLEVKPYTEIQEQNLLWTNAYLLGRGTDSPIDEYNMLSSKNILKGTNNPTMYSNPVVDEYIDKALSTPNEEDALVYWKKAQWDGKTGVSIQGDAVWVPLLTSDHIFFVRDGVDMGELRVSPHIGATWLATESITSWSKGE